MIWSPLSPRKADQYFFFLAEQLSVAVFPGRSRGVFRTRHVQGGQLAAKDRDRFDRNGDQAASPAERARMGDDQQNLPVLRARHVPYDPDGEVILVQHAQSDQIADAHRLWKAPL